MESGVNIQIMGPTASGKTALAIALHEAFDVDLISVDSAQVYRGMDIGTAKPDAETLKQAPHRLIDILDPWESYSAAQFVDDAQTAIQDVHRQNRIPVLVGGTMLYFRSFNQGLSELPNADETIRAEIEAEADALGWAEMHHRLAKVDPIAAQRIHPNDPQRIQRALEVYHITGQPISALQSGLNQQPDGHVLKLVVAPADRVVLHDRIQQRLEQMMADGFVEEVARLRRDPRINLSLPSMRSVGYRQIWAHLEGQDELEQAEQKVLFATRQLAKRQMTWLRKEAEAVWLDPECEDWVNVAKREVERFLHISV